MDFTQASQGASNWQSTVSYEERKRLLVILVGVIKNLGPNYPHDKVVGLAKQYENYIFTTATSKADYVTKCRNKMKSIQETAEQQRNQNGGQAMGNAGNMANMANMGNMANLGNMGNMANMSQNLQGGPDPLSQIQQSSQQPQQQPQQQQQQQQQFDSSLQGMMMGGGSFQQNQQNPQNQGDMNLNPQMMQNAINQFLSQPQNQSQTQPQAQTQAQPQAPQQMSNFFQQSQQPQHGQQGQQSQPGQQAQQSQQGQQQGQQPQQIAGLTQIPQSVFQSLSREQQMQYLQMQKIMSQRQQLQNQAQAQNQGQSQAQGQAQSIQRAGPQNSPHMNMMRQQPQQSPVQQAAQAQQPQQPQQTPQTQQAHPHAQAQQPTPQQQAQKPQGGPQGPMADGPKIDMKAIPIPPSLLAQIPDLPPGVNTWAQISDLLRSGVLPRSAITVVRNAHQTHYQWLARAQQKQQQQQQQPQQQPQQPVTQNSAQDQNQGQFGMQNMQFQGNNAADARRNQMLYQKQQQQQQMQAQRAANQQSAPQSGQDQFTGFQQWDMKNQPNQPTQGAQGGQFQPNRMAQQQQQQGQMPSQAPQAGQPGQSAQQPARPVGLPTLTEADKQKLRQVFEEAAKIPIRLQNFTDELSPEDKRYVEDQIRSMQLMYQRIDQLVPMFFGITKNQHATCRLLQMKSMFKEQMEAVEKGIYLTNPQILDKTKYEINRYFMFVKENLQQTQARMDQPQGQQQQQPQQSQYPNQMMGQFNVQTQQQFQQQQRPQQQAPQPQQSQQRPVQQQQFQQQQAQNRPGMPMYNQPGAPTTQPQQAQAPTVQAQQPQFNQQTFYSQQGYSVDPQSQANQAQASPQFKGQQFVGQNAQQSPVPQQQQPQQQQQQQQQFANRQQQMPFVTQQPQGQALAQTQAQTQIPPQAQQQQQMGQQQMQNIAANRKRSSAASGRQPQGPQQAQGSGVQLTSSPSGVPSYAAQGLTADQLKLPTTRKRKSTPGNSQSATASPEDIKITATNNLSPQGGPAPKREKLDQTELAKQKAFVENLQKKKELSKTKPLAYFITCLGDALDISEDEVNNCIQRGKDNSTNNPGAATANANANGNANAAANAGGGNGAGNGKGSGGVTPTALLRTPLPFSAAKTPASNHGVSSKLVSVPENESTGSAKTQMPPTPPWTGSVQAVAIRNAFQAIDAVKTADIQYLTPPEELDNKSTKLEENNKSSDSNNNDPTSDKVLPVSSLDGGDVMNFKGLEGLDVDVWDYDKVMNAIGKEQSELKKEFWTLD